MVNAVVSQFQHQKFSFSGEDSKFQRMWPGLKVHFGNMSVGQGEAQISQKMAVLEKLKDGWYKANFDGATKGNPGPSGVGAIIRDSQGHFIAFGARKLEDGSNNIAEGKAALLAVGLAKSLGVKNLHLEGDSQVIIQAIINGGTMAWHLQACVQAIISVLNSSKKFEVSHIRRMGNVEANCLSKWAMSFDVIGEIRKEDFCQVVISNF